MTSTKSPGFDPLLPLSTRVYLRSTPTPYGRPNVVDWNTHHSCNSWYNDLPGLKLKFDYNYSNLFKIVLLLILSTNLYWRKNFTFYSIQIQNWSKKSQLLCLKKDIGELKLSVWMSTWRHLPSVRMHPPEPDFPTPLCELHKWIALRHDRGRYLRGFPGSTPHKWIRSCYKSLKMHTNTQKSTESPEIQPPEVFWLYPGAWPTPKNWSNGQRQMAYSWSWDPQLVESGNWWALTFFSQC